MLFIFFFSRSFYWLRRTTEYDINIDDGDECVGVEVTICGKYGGKNVSYMHTSPVFNKIAGRTAYLKDLVSNRF